MKDLIIFMLKLDYYEIRRTTKKVFKVIKYTKLNYVEFML